MANKLLDSIYIDPAHPSSFGSINNLYRDSKKKNSNLKRNDIIHYLQGKDAYTLHVNKNKRFSRRFYEVSRPGNILAADTAYLLSLKDYNDGFGYLIIFIDLFSRYLFVQPIKSMKVVDVLPVFKEVLSESIYKYSKLFTDAGNEFRNKKMLQFYRDEGLINYSVYNQQVKSGVAERCIRTLKGRIYKYLTHTKTSRYIDALPDIVTAYNIASHTGILGYTPFDLHFKTNIADLDIYLSAYYKYKRSRVKSIKCPLAVNSYVRLVSAASSPFTKGYLIRNTYEIFRVKRVNLDHIPVTYDIEGLNKEPILGQFYHNELQAVRKPKVYNITVLKERVRKGETEYFVNYHDYNETPVWIKSNLLEK